MRRDRSRLVIAASGWNDFEVTLGIVGSLVNDEFVVVVFGPWGNFILSQICNFVHQVGHFKDVHVYPGPIDAEGTIVR